MSEIELTAIARLLETRAGLTEDLEIARAESARYRREYLRARDELRDARAVIHFITHGSAEHGVFVPAEVAFERAADFERHWPA